MSFLSKLVSPLKIAVSPVLAADKLLRKVPAYKKVSNLAPFSKERDKALRAAHAVMGSAHNLVKRAEHGDLSAKQAISSTIDAAAKGDPRARAAVHALTAARLQQNAECQLAGGRASAAGARPRSTQSTSGCTSAWAAELAAAMRAGFNAHSGELAIVGAMPANISAAEIAWAKRMLPRMRATVADLQRARNVVAAVFEQCKFDEERADLDAQLRGIDAMIDRARAYLGLLEKCVPRLHPVNVPVHAAGVAGLPHMDRVELVTAGCGAGCSAGAWLPTAGGDVFVPAAYQGTAGARAARGQRLVMTPRITRQIQAAAEQERRGKLPLGTTRRWAERAVSGFQSDHGTAQTLREWLGQEPSLNIALK